MPAEKAPSGNAKTRGASSLPGLSSSPRPTLPHAQDLGQGGRRVPGMKKPPATTPRGRVFILEYIGLRTVIRAGMLRARRRWGQGTADSGKSMAAVRDQAERIPVAGLPALLEALPPDPRPKRGLPRSSKRMGINGREED